MNRFSTLVFGLALATVAEGQPGADAQPEQCCASRFGR